MSAEDAARRQHFADFYTPTDVEGPRGVVLGNCQAESLRQALAGCGVRFLRVPPVHELEADDIPHLQQLLSRVDVIVAQPIRDGYHGLPLGTRQMLEAAPAGVRSTIVPVIRFAGLYPWSAIIRPPQDPGADPPIVPYHDLRTLAAAGGADATARPSTAALRAITSASLEELRSREERHRTVPISDVFDHPSFALMRTINHPGNPVLELLAERVHDRLGLDGATTPLSRPMLDRVHAPREEPVIELFGLDDEPRAHWIVDGERIDDAEVRAAQLAWYREHPDVVQAGLARHAETMRVLGL